MNPIIIIMNKILSDPRINSNEIAKDTVRMMKAGDEKGLQELAMNMCKEKNVTPEEVKNKVLNMFGF